MPFTTDMSPSPVAIIDPKVSVETPDRLPAVMSKHLEMYITTTYDPSYGWSKGDRRELHRILSAVDPKSALGSTHRYQNARKFYRDICRVRREQ